MLRSEMPGSFEALAPEPPRQGHRRAPPPGENPAAVPELVDAEFDEIMTASHGRQGESMADYLAEAEAEQAATGGSRAVAIMHAVLGAAILGMLYLFLRKHL